MSANSTPPVYGWKCAEGRCMPLCSAWGCIGAAVLLQQSCTPLCSLAELTKGKTDMKMPAHCEISRRPGSACSRLAYWGAAYALPHGQR